MEESNNYDQDFLQEIELLPAIPFSSGRQIVNKRATGLTIIKYYFPI